MKIIGDAVGSHGNWKQIHPEAPAEQAHGVITEYVLWVPDAHPAWKKYLMVVCKTDPLRSDNPNTHEFSVCALDPNFEASPPWHYLKPNNVLFQIRILTEDGNDDDEKAMWLAELFAEAVINGRLPIEAGGEGLSNMWRESALRAVA